VLFAQPRPVLAEMPAGIGPPRRKSGSQVRKAKAERGEGEGVQACQRGNSFRFAKNACVWGMRKKGNKRDTKAIGQGEGITIGVP